MKRFAFLLLLLAGCNSPLLPHHYTEPKQDTSRHEPYAVFDYEDAMGRFYLVSWKGNILNGLDFTKKQLADINLPTFEQ